MKATEVCVGIVLKSAPFGESDTRITVLTTEGLRTVTAAGARKSTAKLKAAVQLFTIAEFTVTGARLTGAAVFQTGTGIARDINRYYLACSVSEVLQKCTMHDEQCTAQIFYLAVRTFESLIDRQTSAYKIFINFFAKFLILLGYDIEPFENSDIIDAFRAQPDDAIDEIKLTLADAKNCAKHITAAYEKFVDIEIPNAEIFH
jgi:DNA repair protein RecO